MDIKICNTEYSSLRVTLEPWAIEYFISKNEFILFKAEGPVPPGSYYEVETSDYGITVTPEWESALVHAYGIDGEKID